MNRCNNVHFQVHEGGMYGGMLTCTGLGGLWLGRLLLALLADDLKSKQVRTGTPPQEMHSPSVLAFQVRTRPKRICKTK